MPVRQHPWAHLIPSPRLQSLHLLGPADRTKAIEAGYEPGGGIVGAFDLHPETWAHRISNYDRDEFRADTYGPHDFSEVFDSLSSDEGDGCHVYTADAFKAFKRDGVHQDVNWLFKGAQSVGNCVDASNVEMKQGLLGVRAMDPQFNEVMKFLAAFWTYQYRGYCSHGWSGSACATMNKNYGWAPATVIEVDGNKLDYDDENESESLVSSQWCRGGCPQWLEDWVVKNFPWEPSAVTYMDGGLDALKKLFQNRGQYHHGSNWTSGSHKPNVGKRIGGHMQTAFGGDWSDKTRAWFANLGFKIDADDFWVPNHQHWGPGWSGELAAEYWPEWWGPKPEGAWVVSAKNLLANVDGYAYLPRLKGIAGATPPPNPDPTWPFTVAANLNTDNGGPIRGDIKFTVDGRSYNGIVAKKPGSAPVVYEIVPKPFS